MSRSRILTAALSLGLLAGTAGAVTQSSADDGDSARPIYCYRIIKVDGKTYYEPRDC
jgi:hypothetical protein